MESVFPDNQITKVNKWQIKSLLLSNEGKLVALNLVTAFFLRLFFIRYQYVINTDGVYYLIMGRKLITGDFVGGIGCYWAPFYPLMVGISSLIFNDLEFAGRFVSVVAGTLIVVPTYILIRNFYGKLAASLGAFLIVIQPNLIWNSTSLMTESLYTLIFTTGLLVGWYALCSNKTQTFFFTGLLFGAAYLTKPEAIGFIGLFFVITIIAKLFQSRLAFYKVSVNCLLLIIGFLILSLPYVAYLNQKTGHWTISQKVMNNLPSAGLSTPLLKLKNDGQTTTLDQLFGETYESISQSTTVLPAPLTLPMPAVVTESALPSPSRPSPQSFAARVFDILKKELKEMVPQIFPYLFIFLAIIGLFRQPWTKLRTAKEIYLTLFLSATLIGYSLTYAEERYLLAVVPILLCWASNGIIEFEKWLIDSARDFGIELQAQGGLVRAGILVVLVLSLLPSIIRPMKANKWDQDLPFEHKMAGLWLKEHSALSSPKVMACGPGAAYYSSGTHLYIPDEPYPAIFEYAKRQNVNYLIISERCSDIMPTLRNTSLAPLFDEQNAPPELKLVYKNDEIPAYQVLMYEFTPAQ
ncbi:MAG: glycosyltransferase family 39 protein [Pyrinomonadaceae bacterium]